MALFEASAAELTSYPGGKWEPGPARYGAVTVDEVPLTMDDGVILRASISYPTDLLTGQRAAGTFPVVIEHTPYVRLGQPVNPITYLTEHGYIYVVVRTRGMGTSTGEVARQNPREALDGKAIVDWAAHKLEGSDGRIALLGCSYPAGVALASAAHVGPDSPVKAVVAACNGMNMNGSVLSMVGGMMTTGFWNYMPRAPRALWGGNPAAVSYAERMMAEVQSGGDAAYDRDFARDRTPLRWVQNIVDNGMPVLLWTGWRDIADVRAIRTYVAFQNAYAKRPVHAPMAPDQQVSPRYQIIVGDWEHAVGLDAGIYLQWLETWVKGVDTGISKTRTPMHLFEPGSKRWVNLARYPVTTNYTRWSFNGAGKLVSGNAKGNGSEQLVWGDPAQKGSKLVLSTPPLAQGATLAGPISATIYASSSNTNLQLLAHLFDVAPDGSATPLSKGVMMGSLRAIDPSRSWTDARGTVIQPWQTLERDDYLKPGKVYRFDLGLAPRLWAINPGHSLRLELTTQSPLDVCPPSGAPPRNGTDPCRLTAPQQASVPGGVYKILYGPKWPSALNLPQLPWKVFPEARAGVVPTAWNENQRRLESRELTLPLDWGSDQ
jgi:predicted acyl esterase